MPRPQTVSDAEIRAAAREVFVQEGPSASVARVAERLGVSHAALFARAGSKARLMREALGPDRPAAIAALAEPPPARRAAARLVAILAGLMQFLRRVVPNVVVLKAAGLELPEAPGVEPPPVMLRRMLKAWLRAAAATGALPRVDPVAVAEGLLGAIEARCFNAYLGGASYAPGDDKAFLRALVAGLLRPGRRSAD
jgi:AcrR family transcriptional regulator